MTTSTAIKIKLTKHGALARKKTADGRNKWVKVAPRIQLRAIGARPDRSHLAEIRFHPLKGPVRSELVDWSLMLAEKKTDLKARLATLGYEWPQDKAISDAIWIKLVSSRPKREFIIVSTPGWHANGFALPGRFFSPDATAVPVIIDPNSVEHVGAFLTGEGVLRDWQQTVGKLARKSSPLCVAISAALAAPLLRKLNMDSFAINWFGTTSEGKSLTLKVAASVAGLFGPGNTMPSWADSEAGFEGQAMGHRDCVLPLDEAADGEKAMSLAARARTLAFGIARNRPRTLAATYEKQHGLENREYRIIVLSSSERALGEVAQQAGKPRLGGEEVRLIDVPASEPDSQGIFDGKIKTEDEKSLLATTKALVEELSDASQKYQGHALPAFLTKLMTDKNWERTVRSYKDEFEAQVNAPGLKAVYRIRSNFAIIWAAAALAIDYKVLLWKKARTFRAIEKCFRRALAALQSPATTAAAESSASNSANVLQTLKEKLDQCDLRSVQQGKKASEEEATARQKADGFIINGVTYLKNDRIEGWFPSSQDRSILRKANIFRTQRKDTPTVNKKISGIEGKPRYYAIETEILNRLLATR